MNARFETFTQLLTRISRSIKRIKTRQMAKYNLKAPHVSCLYYLSQGGPMTAAELCDRCEEDKAAISRSLDSLERMGYVRCDCPEGKRYKALLTLTEKGALVGKEIREEINRLLDAAGGELPEEQRCAMYAALMRIAENLESITKENTHE